MRSMARYAVTALVVSLAAATVSAQGTGPFKLYAGGGFTKQHRPGFFEEHYKMGYHMAAGVGYQIIPMLEASLEFRHQGFATSLTIAGLGNVTEGKITANMFGVSFRAAPEIVPLPIVPYGVGGAGFAMMKRDEFDYPPETKVGTAEGWDMVFRLEDQTKLYYSIGGGVRYALMPKVGLFAEARYTSISTEQDNSIFDKPIRFWAVTAGVRVL